MIKKLKMLLLIGLLSAPAMAGDITGIVTDAVTKEPLPGAHVSISGTKFGAASESDGHFRMRNLAAGKYDLTIHLIGYKKTSRKVTIDENGEANLAIALEQSPWELDEVVVTATRRKHILKDVPVTTEVITKDDMQATGALTVDQALDSHIGINVEDDLSGKSATLRGIDPSRILILIDGHRVIGRVNGSIDLGQISLSDVDRIEIVKGSGSTLYGSDAMGGVINIITKKPSATSKLETSMEYGTFNTFDPEFQFEAARSKVGILIAGKHEQTDGFDLIKSTPHTNGQEAIKRYNFNTKFNYSPKPSFYNELSLGYMHERKQWVESEYFVPLDTTFAYDDYEWNNRYDISTLHRYVASPRTEFEASVHSSFYDHEWSKYTRTNTLDDNSTTDDYIYEGSLQANHAFTPRAILTSGADISYAKLKSVQIEDTLKAVTSGDIYTQFEYSPVTNFTFLPGIRWEKHQTYGEHINPSINLKWSPSERFTLRGTASKGFRAPSIKELYFIFDHSAAGYIVYGGGNGLNPEKSDNFSLTGELNYGRRGLHRLTVFRNNLNNLIEFDLVGYSSEYWRGIYRYRNIVKARTEGLEWESKVKVCSGWDFSLSYNFLKARNLTEKADLINRPRNTVKISNTFYLSKWDAGVTFWGVYNDHKLWTSEGDTPDLTSNIYAPKHIVLNINVYRRFFNLMETYFRVENLTNEINATYGYWPPRMYTVGLRFNLFNGANGSKE